MGKFCEDNEDIGFKLCDDPIVEEDCVSKGEDYCWSRSDCYGIMFNKEWASANLGVKICKSSTLIEKDKKDWDLFLKCSKSKQQYLPSLNLAFYKILENTFNSR